MPTPGQVHAFVWFPRMLVMFCLCAWTLPHAFSQDVSSVAGREQQIRTIRKQIKNAQPHEQIELEHRLASLWLGEGCAEPADLQQFQIQVKRILDAYPQVDTHYAYLDLKITYAQLQPAEQQEHLLWQVIRIPPEHIRPPKGRDARRAVNRIKQSAIFALLNHRMAGSIRADRPELLKKMAIENDRIMVELGQFEEGIRCTPLAQWYHDVVIAERDEPVPMPELAPPAVGQWEPVKAEPKKIDEIPTKIIFDTRPQGPKWTKEFESISTVSGVTPAPPLPEQSTEWWRYALGALGLAIVVGGIQLPRSKQRG